MSQATNLQTSNLVQTGPGILYKVLIGSHSSGTLKLWDSTSEDFKVILPTYSYPAGSSVIDFGPEGVNFTEGLYATLANAQDISIIWQRTN